VNIVGGFRVTKKMLDLFKRPGDPEENNEVRLSRRCSFWCRGLYLPMAVAEKGNGQEEGPKEVTAELGGEAVVKRRREALAWFVSSLACLRAARSPAER